MKKIITMLLGVVLADQITKGFLLHTVTGTWHWFGDAMTIVPNPYMMARVTDWFNIVFTWNPGTSFSLFRTAPQMMMIILTGTIIAALMYRLFKNVDEWREVVAMSLIVGGALGNLIDRIRFGAVIDFIDWHAWGVHWPAFNIADACICMGVGLYIWYFIRNRR